MKVYKRTHKRITPAFTPIWSKKYEAWIVLNPKRKIIAQYTPGNPADLIKMLEAFIRAEIAAKRHAERHYKFLGF